MARGNTPTNVRTLSEGHKKALTSGRLESKAIGDYVDALKAGAGKARKSRRTRDDVRAEIKEAKAELRTARAVDRVRLQQRLIDLDVELGEIAKFVDIAPLEREFIKVVKRFSERNGITWTAWRKVGVSAAVLRAAKVPPTRQYRRVA